MKIKLASFSHENYLCFIHNITQSFQSSNIWKIPGERKQWTVFNNLSIYIERITSNLNILRRAMKMQNDDTNVNY